MHDPANELFDRACELLDAAQRLSAALDAPGAAPAHPATLGCLEEALCALGDAAAGMPDGHQLAGGLSEAARHARAAREALAARMSV